MLQTRLEYYLDVVFGIASTASAKTALPANPPISPGADCLLNISRIDKISLE